MFHCICSISRYKGVQAGLQADSSKCCSISLEIQFFRLVYVCFTRKGSAVSRGNLKLSPDVGFVQHG